MGHLLTVAKMQLGSEQIRNTFWWGGNDATHTNAQDIIDEIADAFYDTLRTYLVTEWQLYAFDVYDKTVAGAPGIEYVPASGAFYGTQAGNPTPFQVALRLDLKASVPKPNTNRKFIGGWPETEFVAGGIFSSAAETQVRAFGQRLLDLPTAISKAVVLEVVSLNAIDGTVTGSNPLTYYQTTRIPSTLRRRKVGVGI